MPWRIEDELLGDHECYESRYKAVKMQISSNIKNHEPFEDINFEDLPIPYENDTSDEEENQDNEFSMYDPSLIDLDDDSENQGQIRSGASASIEVVSMSNETFYEMCSQMNEKQLYLFNFIMKYAVECRYSERNNTVAPTPFNIFLSGGGGVGKSFLIKLLTEYLRRTLRYPEQLLDKQPSVCVTASTGKAATNINGTTVHSAFQLPIRRAGRSFEYTKAGSERIHTLRNKYKFLKVLIVDEISMLGNETFNHLNLRLQDIMGNRFPFGGVSLLICGDLLQLQPVKQQGVWIPPKTCSYNAFQGSIWENYFFLHELIDIVRQSSDLQFAEMLKRIREGKQTEEDIEEIKKLKDTNTSLWSEKVTKLFLTNHLANQDNIQTMESLGETVYTFNAKDSGRDTQTRIKTITIDKLKSLSDTGNLPTELKVCVGSRFMLTINLDVNEHLVNGQLGTVKHKTYNNRHPLLSTIFVKFDDEDAGKSRKNRKYRGELKECVPINAMPKTFPYSRGKTMITVERTQFPGILAHSITVHKSQGSTLEYMIGDQDRTTKNKGNYKVPIWEGLFYTLLSRGRRRDRIKLLNFEPDHIKVNSSALEEIERMRKEAAFEWMHPVIKLSGQKICLLNIRSWNAHIEHILTDETYTNDSVILCFTETHVRDNNTNRIEYYEKEWLDLHKPTEHGLAICYNTRHVKVIKEFDVVSQLEMLPVLLEVDKEQVLLILVYRTGPVRNFVAEFAEELLLLPTNKRTIILGDFNMDQMLSNNVELLQPLVTQFHLHQRVKFSTHIHGGILDIVLDNSDSSEDADWLPCPYSDHFVVIINL